MLPQLRAAGLAALADRLHAEHAEMAQRWGLLRVPLLAWRGGEPALMDADLLLHYITLYGAHPAVEEHQAFVRAGSGLDAAALFRMEKETASRRWGA